MLPARGPENARGSEKASMSKLHMLNALIDKIGSEADANQLVKSILPHHAPTIDEPFMGTEAGVRNCSLIAEFAFTYVSPGRINYEAIQAAKPFAVLKPPYDKLPFKGESGVEALHLQMSGHEMALLRDDKTVALYQAWEKRFHVFPKLNPSGEAFNVFGDGEAARYAISKMLCTVCSRAEIDVRRATT
jgi:hypothetical protein